MEFYPLDLPLPLQSGYSIKRAPSVIRTSMTDGSVFQRRMRKFAPMTANVTISLQGERKAEFDKFIAKCADGADWFVMPLLIGTKIEPRKVRIQSGKTSENLQFRSDGGALWQVSLTLDVDEVTTQNDEWDEFYSSAPWFEGAENG